MYTRVRNSIAVNCVKYLTCGSDRSVLRAVRAPCTCYELVRRSSYSSCGLQLLLCCGFSVFSKAWTNARPGAAAPVLRGCPDGGGAATAAPHAHTTAANAFLVHGPPAKTSDTDTIREVTQIRKTDSPCQHQHQLARSLVPSILSSVYLF